MVHIILHYSHISQTKYACQIVHLCSTALLLLSTYRSHITFHISKKEWQTATLFTMLLPEICPSNTIYMPYMQISLYAEMRQLCWYIYFTWIYCNQQCNHMNWYTYISNYWHMPLNKYAWHMTHVCPTALIMLSTCWPHITVYISQNQQQQLKVHLPCYNHIFASKNMVLKCNTFCIYELIHVQVWTTMSIHIPDMNSLQYTSEEIHLLYGRYMSCCNSSIAASTIEKVLILICLL